MFYSLLLKTIGQDEALIIINCRAGQQFCPSAQHPAAVQGAQQSSHIATTCHAALCSWPHANVVICVQGIASSCGVGWITGTPTVISWEQFNCIESILIALEQLLSGFCWKASHFKLNPSMDKLYESKSLQPVVLHCCCSHHTGASLLKPLKNRKNIESGQKCTYPESCGSD